MSKKHSHFLTSEEVARRLDLELKNPGFAALLGWLVPGLGHLYQGRTAKGAIFMLSIVSLLVFGIYVGRGEGKTMTHVVHASTEPFSLGGGPGSGGVLGGLVRTAGNHWKFVCQAGVGGVAIPALVERHRVRNNKPALIEMFRPPSPNDVAASTDSQQNTVRHPNELAKWNYEAGFYFELGTIYTVIAGLLNILAVYDAARGPLLSVPVEKDAEGKSPPQD